MNIDKLRSGAAKLDTFFKVLQGIVGICMIVVLCFMVVLTIVNAVDPDAIIGEDLNVVDIGPVSLEFSEEHTPKNSSILIYAWFYSVFGIVSGVVIYIGLNYIRKILAPMSEGNPFDSETARYIKKLAVLSLILGIVENIGGLIEAPAVLHLFRLSGLVDSGVIRSISVNYTFEPGFIVVFFILLLMSYIFSYGAQLQQLSDETL